MNRAAQALARLARGKHRRLTAADKARRAAQLAGVRYRGGRKKGSKNRRKDGAQ